MKPLEEIWNRLTKYEKEGVMTDVITVEDGFSVYGETIAGYAGCAELIENDM